MKIPPFVLFVVVVFFAGPSFGGEALAAGCAWAETFFASDLDDPVSALAVYDDGTGEALYAGGVFNTAGGVTVNQVARWDGIPVVSSLRALWHRYEWRGLDVGGV